MNSIPCNPDKVNNLSLKPEDIKLNSYRVSKNTKNSSNLEFVDDLKNIHKKCQRLNIDLDNLINSNQVYEGWGRIY